MLTYEQASDKVIIALDCSRERAFELADMLAGKAKAAKIMDELGISATRRVKGLGARQREQLIEALSK